MKKLLAILLSALLLMTLLAACGTTDEPAADSPAPVSEAPESEAPVESAEPVELTIWHDNDENLMQAMADAANALLEGTGVSVTFETVSYTHLDVYKRQVIHNSTASGKPHEGIHSERQVSTRAIAYSVPR